MPGVQIGLRDLHYAALTKDDDTGVTYGTPVPIAGAINAKISPKVNTSTLFTDDGPDEVSSALGEIEVELSVKDLDLATQAVLLGHTVGTDKVMLKKADDVAPYVAVGFKSLKSNGKFRYVWLYKGKFKLPEQEYKTKQDTPEFQVPVITGTFVKRQNDGAWQAIGDEDDTGFSGTGWFTAVYQKA
jgi:phi13 family phage major tail protein